MKQIYVHGLGQTSDSWTKTIDILQTTDYSLCPNLPDLVHSKEVTYDNLYAAFSDYCNQYDEPIDLCGLSLGGVLALNYAIQYPKKVRSLVLIATQYKMPKKLLNFKIFSLDLCLNPCFNKWDLEKLISYFYAKP